LSYDKRVKKLGLELPDYAKTPYYGPSYGSMKAHHQVGSMLFLGGHLPEYLDNSILHPGHLGAGVSIAEGYEAARLAGLNALGGIKYALGSLDKVVGIIRSLNFVACTPISVMSIGCPVARLTCGPRYSETSTAWAGERPSV
jgi:hypothetical protein